MDIRISLLSLIIGYTRNQWVPVKQVLMERDGVAHTAHHNAGHAELHNGEKNSRHGFDNQYAHNSKQHEERTSERLPFKEHTISSSGYSSSPSSSYRSSGGYGAPSSGYNAPSSTYGAPSSSYGAPSSSYGAPSSSYGAPSSSYGAPSSSYGAPSSSYDAPSSGYGTPSNGYGAPSSGYGAPSSGYGAPSSGYGAPSSGYGGPSSDYDAPTHGYDAPSSGYSAPATGYGAATSSYSSPSSYSAPASYGSHQTYPSYEEHKYVTADSAIPAWVLPTIAAVCGIGLLFPTMVTIPVKRRRRRREAARPVPNMDFGSDNCQDNWLCELLGRIRNRQDHISEFSKGFPAF